MILLDWDVETQMEVVALVSKVFLVADVVAHLSKWIVSRN